MVFTCRPWALGCVKETFSLFKEAAQGNGCLASRNQCECNMILFQRDYEKLEAILHPVGLKRDVSIS